MCLYNYKYIISLSSYIQHLATSKGFLPMRSTSKAHPNMPSLCSSKRSLRLSHRKLPLLSATGVPSNRKRPYSRIGESHRKGTLSRNCS